MEIDSFSPTSRQHWREWLQDHHDKTQSIWLVYPKKKSTTLGVTYAEAVEEALCYGWIDSQVKPVDDYTYRQFFTRRKPNSGWSKINKERVQRLTEAGRMTSAGIACVDRAKQNGSWLLLDGIEALIIPADLAEAFQKRPNAKRYFLSLCRSDRRAILGWLVLAKRALTRQSRLTEVVESADQERKPKPIQWRKN